MSVTPADVRGVDPMRDLGSVEFWEGSLARSRQRRRLSEIGRRSRRRRKSATLAMSAALVAAPVLPRTLATARSGPEAPGSIDTATRGLLAADATRCCFSPAAMEDSSPRRAPAPCLCDDGSRCVRGQRPRPGEQCHGCAGRASPRGGGEVLAGRKRLHAVASTACFDAAPTHRMCGRARIPPHRG
jgi:hypothetical protein